MLTLVIYKDVLKSGRGADRATATLLNALVHRGYQLHLITQHRPDEPFSVELDPAIQCHSIATPKCRFKTSINKWFLKYAWGENLLRRFFPSCDLTLQTHRRLRAIIENIHPDLILSSGTNETNDLCAEGVLPAPLLHLFHIFPLEAFKKNKLQRVTRFKRALRTHVSACQVLLPSHREILKPYTSAPITVIGNALNVPSNLPLVSTEERAKELIYIAYFSKDKNQLQLIEAFAQTQASKTWRLKLYGTGSPEWEARLKACAATHKIADRVDFMGITNDPYPLLTHAAICAYPSLTEGFGMALAEAMWCGCACLGFKTATGVNELLTDDFTGRLVEPSTQAFASAIDDLVLHPSVRERLAANAMQAVRKAYAPEVIWDAWEALITSVHSHFSTPSRNK